VRLASALFSAFSDPEGIQCRLKDFPVDILLMQLAHSKINPAVVEVICIGNVNEPGVPYKGPVASLAAGFPNTTSVSSANLSQPILFFGLFSARYYNGR
jgi:hypothetical protein